MTIKERTNTKIKMRKNDIKRHKTEVEKQRSTNNEIERVISDIRQLRAQNKTDNEIRDILGLELRTFQRYAKRINEIDKELWYSVTSDEIYSQFLLMKESLEHSYRKAKELSESTKDVGEILEALDAKDNMRMNIVMLLAEGPS